MDAALHEGVDQQPVQEVVEPDLQAPQLELRQVEPRDVAQLALEVPQRLAGLGEERARGVDAAEAGLLPDFALRAAIRRLCRTRLESGR